MFLRTHPSICLQTPHWTAEHNRKLRELLAAFPRLFVRPVVHPERLHTYEDYTRVEMWGREVSSLPFTLLISAFSSWRRMRTSIAVRSTASTRSIRFSPLDAIWMTSELCGQFNE